MARNKVRRCFSAPGKVFLLGEYAVLGGAPALVSAVPPRFELESKAGETLKFAPESPAGKLLENYGKPVHAVFRDRHEEKGGFGASTAQFALLYRALATEAGWEPSWKAAWEMYRGLTRDAELPPSGADLVAQWQGGTVYVQAERGVCEKLKSTPALESVMVFSASGQPGRKVATHEHLRAVAAGGVVNDRRFMSKLAMLVDDGVAAVRAGEVNALGRAFEAYGDELRERGLETAATSADRAALRRVSGVWGVKGAGALQADALVVAFDGSASERKELVSAARERCLEPVVESLRAEPGILSPESEP